MDGYIIPAGYGEAEYLDKKSRFIGQAQHAPSISEAMAFVESARKKYSDATHNVWAYALADGSLRWSDDGEPGGTAGQPVLNVLRSAGVEDAVYMIRAVRSFYQTRFVLDGEGGCRFLNA